MKSMFWHFNNVGRRLTLFLLILAFILVATNMPHAAYGFSANQFNANYTPNWDVYGDTSYGMYWRDGGNDAFDAAGYPRVWVGSSSGWVPINIQYNAPESSWNVTLGGTVLNIRHQQLGNAYVWLVSKVSGSATKARFTLSGNMGSDGWTQYGVGAVTQGTFWYKWAWNDDYSGGDPRVWWAIVPSVQAEYNIPSFSWSGDNISHNSGELTLPFAVVMAWGYTSDSAFTSWVSSEMPKILQVVQVPGKPQLAWNAGVPYWNTTVAWSANGNPSGTTYELWRKTFNSSGQVVKDEKIYTGTSTSFVTSDQGPGYYYRYRVRAIYGGQTSGFSQETSYWTTSQPTIAAVARGIKVSWAPVYPNVTYRVWARQVGGSWYEAGRTTSTTFTVSDLDPMKEYEIAVSPILAEGGTDWWYGAGSTYPLAATPGNPTFSSGSNNILVSWSANGNPAGVPYELCRDGVKIYEGTATSHNDTGLSPGKTYKYKVRAKNGAGQYTSFTAELTWGTAPPAPSISTVSHAGQGWSTSSNGQVHVLMNWNAVSGATGYRVYANGSLAPGGDVGNKTVWSGNLSSGASLQLQVSAYNGYGESAKSGARSILPPNRKDSAAVQAQMLINNGQLIAPSKYVVVSVSAVDPLQTNYTGTSADDASNPKKVRLSNDNANWSEWMPYGFSNRALMDISNSFESFDFEFKGDSQNSNGVVLNVGDGWRVSTHYNTAAIKSMSDGGFHGRKYIRFEHDGSSGWKGLVRGITITGGKWYRITAYARTNSEAPVDISGDYAFYSSAFQKKFTWEKEVKSANGWVKGQAVFQALDTIGGGIYLYGLTNGANGVTLDYDYVAVEQFDQQPSGDILPDGPFTWTLDETGFGKKTVYVQVQDAAGNTVTVSGDINYYLVDMQAPSVNLSINGSQQYTSSANVMLEISAKDDLTQADLLKMRLSNDFQSWTQWEPYKPYREWQLSGGDGMKTVYVQVQDASGNIGTAHASIVLKTSNPGVQVNTAVLSSNSGTPGTITLNGQVVNARFVKGSEVVLILNAPGASYVQWSMDNIRWTASEPVSSQKTIALPDWEGTKTVYARLPDGSVYSVTFVVDRTPPVVSASWQKGATASSSSQAAVVLTATDNYTPDEQLEVSYDGVNWVPYSRVVNVPLPGVGFNEVTIMVKDKAGNIAKQTLGIWRL